MSERIDHAAIAGIGAVGFQLIRFLHKQQVPVIGLVRPGSEDKVVRRLNDEWSINASIQPGSDVQIQGVDFTNMALLAQALEGSTHLFNTIADFSEGGSGAMAQASRTNIDIPNNLQHAGQEAGLKKMVQISSTAVYGNQPGDVNEDSRRTPSSVYGKTKATADKMLLEPRSYKGLPTTILEPGNIFGVGADKWTKLLYDISAQRERLAMGKGKNLMTPVDIADVVQAVILTAASPETDGKRYILVSGNKVTLAEILQAYEMCLTDNAAVYTPAFLGMAYATFEDLRTRFTGGFSSVTIEYINIATNTTWHVDGSRAEKEIPGFNYTPLCQTMKDSMMWLNEKHGLKRDPQIDSFFQENPYAFTRTY